MTTLDAQKLDFSTGGDPLAATIVNHWQEWNSFRASWIEEKKELRQYLVATDTRKTNNSNLPWKNTTTIPKITQIKDNLHANYMAALFPNDDWLVWEADNADSALQEKRENIEAYIKNKLNRSSFKDTISSLVSDYIEYGNSFGIVDLETATKKDPKTGQVNTVFVGPTLTRISPFDIVFDPTAVSFDKSPKIIRSIKSIGQLVKDVKNQPSLEYDPTVLNKILDERAAFNNLSQTDQNKSTGYVADGFGSFTKYFSSNNVEILEFWGDLYDVEKGELLEDYVVTIVDGKYILRAFPNPSWEGIAPIHHIGWRTRSDNLWAMGPLDNLVGMQYRIDHIENSAADAIDLTIHPPLKVVGNPSDFDWQPAEYIYVGDEGDVEPVRIDPNIFSIDFKIDTYERRMEELAGAPKQAAGFRTPGEKTKFEVQVLEDGAGRIFHSKTSRFEALFLEPIINSMLEISVRNLSGKDTIKVLDDTGALIFSTVTRDDIIGTGRLRPTGARHFAADARFVQEVTAMMSSSIGQDPLVRAHLSGKALAKRMAEMVGFKEMFGELVGLEEQAEIARVSTVLSEQQAVDDVTPDVEDLNA